MCRRPGCKSVNKLQIGGLSVENPLSVGHQDKSDSKYGKRATLPFQEAPAMDGHSARLGKGGSQQEEQRLGVFAVAHGSHSLTPMESGDVAVTGTGVQLLEARTPTLHKTRTVPNTGKSGVEKTSFRRGGGGWGPFELPSSRTEPVGALGGQILQSPGVWEGKATSE